MSISQRILETHSAEVARQARVRREEQLQLEIDASNARAASSKALRRPNKVHASLPWTQRPAGFALLASEGKTCVVDSDGEQSKRKRSNKSSVRRSGALRRGEKRRGRQMPCTGPSSTFQPSDQDFPNAGDDSCTKRVVGNSHVQFKTAPPKERKNEVKLTDVEYLAGEIQAALWTSKLTRSVVSPLPPPMCGRGGSGRDV